MKHNRHRLKDWRNGKYPRWTCRIVWYEEANHTNIRLQMEDCERRLDVFPTSYEDAQRIWDLFRMGSPAEGLHQPVITDLVQLLKDGGIEVPVRGR